MRVTKKILVVKINMLGDMVTFLPALNSIKKGMPDAEITLLTTSVGAELVRLTGLVDNIWVASPSEMRSILGFIKWWRQIADKKFDIAISSYDSPSLTGLSLYLSSIPVRIGYNCAKLAKAYNKLVHFSRRMHMVDLNLSSIKELGLPALKDRLSINISEADKEIIDKMLIEAGINKGELIIGMHPGSHTAPRWMADRFSGLAHELITNYSARIICVGSYEEKPIMDDINSKIKTKIIDFTGRTTISQLVYLISKMSILIGHSSGPLHLAYFIGTPTVSLWGVSLPENWGPYWDKERHACLISKLDCLGCDRGKCPRGTLECMSSISVEKVLDNTLRGLGRKKIF
ncbi:MAG: glycosyltransferase family 9 protein [Planctomycetota bacterium]